MRIAIFGATSQIAKDLVISFSAQANHDLALFARRPEIATQWLASVGLGGRYTPAEFADFGLDQHFDAILNFVGVGNPAQTVTMGASIFDVTLKFDEMALSYVRKHPDCRYLFLSSGAAYGSSFDEPADENTQAVFAINKLRPQDWYGAAKLHAECRHRSLPNLPIVDIRVFNYFSHTQDISARFFITDILRAIQSGKTLITSPDNIVRDYIGPCDFCHLVLLILSAPAANDVLDSYTKAPVDKMTLLSAMKARFGLSYEVSEAMAGVNATGMKLMYFSKNHKAEKYGYLSSKNSLDGILDESTLLFEEIGL